MDEIGQRLKAARDRRLMTQAELASASGIPIVTISRIENAHLATRPMQRTVKKLADALGVDPVWLMFGEDRDER